MNHSNENVSFLIGFAYPDTLIPESTKVWRYTGTNGLNGISPNGYSFEDSEADWEETFQANNASRITFFLFSVDTLSKYGWEDVRSHNRVLARKNFSLQDLKNSGYTVSYP